MRAIRIEAELRAAIGAQPPEAAAAVDESVCRGNP